MGFSCLLYTYSTSEHNGMSPFLSMKTLLQDNQRFNTSIHFVPLLLKKNLTQSLMTDA